MNEFIRSWSLAITNLDALEKSYDDTPDGALKTDLLYSYAKYGTQCMVALINGKPAESPVLDEKVDVYAYFPREFGIVQLISWADRKGVRPKIVHLGMAHGYLKSAARKLQDGGDVQEYLDMLQTYARSAHFTLKAILEPA